MRVGRAWDTTVMFCAAAVVVLLAGCESSGRGPASEGQGSHSHHRRGASGMHFYVRDRSDPDWLAKAATFHGHLGPWVTVGAMIGEDAVKRLRTPGQWEVRVICWMPPEKQRTPFSCILDGLQTATGATMGKRNIRFEFSEKVVRDGQPVVYVIRLPDHEVPAEGLVYHMKAKLAAIMANISPDRLEGISREIAGQPADELLEIRPMTADELAPAENPA